MANIPWHEEVLGFVHKLAERLEGYKMACEHEHSNCVLLAHQKVRGMGVGGEEER